MKWDETQEVITIKKKRFKHEDQVKSNRRKKNMKNNFLHEKIR